jgi:cysteinyl-tRNA synthetase
VYSTASIGNLRAYIFTDILKKVIEFDGHKIKDVMNLTDVGHLVGDGDDGEDKVEKAARQRGTTPQEIAKTYTDQFFTDCARLNIRRPQIVAPATDYISQMVDFVAALEKKGLTYNTTDGVYFNSALFPDYNKLSRQPIEKNIGGVRVDMGGKKNINDFALWKFVDKNSLQKWSTKWCPCGAPGWHIECSAIARANLGDTFDIHTGGIDHINIHHTNEIAQTESVTGKKMCNFFMHNEFITVDGGKMSKSLGNVFSVDDLVARGHNPLAFRYMCLGTHYRSILNFTFDGLTAAGNAYNNLISNLAKHKNGAGLYTPDNQIREALCDDLNTPRVLGLVWDLLKSPPSADIYRYVLSLDAVLSLDLEKAVKGLQNKSADIPPAILDLATKRQTAKAAKDFKTADGLRAQIESAGYEIKDTKDGFVVGKK